MVGLVEEGSAEGMTNVFLTFGVVGLGILAFAGIIWLAERKGKADLRQEQRDEDLRRLRDAIEADARARERFARGELLKDDGHRRD